MAGGPSMMIRRGTWIGLIAATLGGATGCHGLTSGRTGTDLLGATGHAGLSGLLIGPEAAAQAPPPAELPAKETARIAFRTAQEFEKNGRIPEAIQFYEKARAHDPTLARAAGRRLAVLYDLSGEFGKADAEYAELLPHAPKDPDLLNDLGYSYYCRGQWSLAEQYLAQAVQLQPQHKKAWVNLGLARAQQGKWEESLAAFQQAVRPAEAYCNLAFVLAAQGRTAEAVAHYRRALELDPSLRLAQAALAKLEPAVAATTQ